MHLKWWMLIYFVWYHFYASCLAWSVYFDSAYLIVNGDDMPLHRANVVWLWVTGFTTWRMVSNRWRHEIRGTFAIHSEGQLARHCAMTHLSNADSHLFNGITHQPSLATVQMPVLCVSIHTLESDFDSITAEYSTTFHCPGRWQECLLFSDALSSK